MLIASKRYIPGVYIFFLLSSVLGCEKFQNKLHQQSKKPAESAEAAHQSTQEEHHAADAEAAHETAHHEEQGKEASNHDTQESHAATHHATANSQKHGGSGLICDKNAQNFVIFEETTGEFFYCKDGSFKKVPHTLGGLPPHKKKIHKKERSMDMHSSHHTDTDGMKDMKDKSHQKKKGNKKFYCEKSNLADYVCKPHKKPKHKEEPKEH